MDARSSAPSPANDATTRAEQAVSVLRKEREATLRAFLGLSEADTQERIDWRGSPQSVNQRIMAFSTHLMDHQQHLLRLLFARGRGISAAEYLLMKAAAEMAEFEVMCLALNDADFAAQGPNEGDWSAEQIIDHVIRAEKGYRERIQAGLDAVRAARAAAEGDGASA
jgi:uncharacterized damage-inducible protein DinB